MSRGPWKRKKKYGAHSPKCECGQRKTYAKEKCRMCLAKENGLRTIDKLQIAARRAPIHRRGESSINRRVYLVDREGRVVKDSTLGEVEKKILQRAGIEFDAGARTVKALCGFCGTIFSIKPKGAVARCCKKCLIRRACKKCGHRSNSVSNKGGICAACLGHRPRGSGGRKVKFNGKCIDCGAVTVKKTAVRCRACAHVFRFGDKKPDATPRACADCGKVGKTKRCKPCSSRYNGRKSSGHKNKLENHASLLANLSMSDRAVAKIIGVSKTTITNHRRRL